MTIRRQTADGAAYNPATSMIQSIDSAPLLIYCHSPLRPDATLGPGGDDKYADYPISEVAGSIAKRLRSYHGVERLLQQSTNGRTVQVVYIVDELEPENDTNSTKSEIRVINTRRLLCGGGEDGRVPISHRGPKGWSLIPNGIGGWLQGLTFLGGGGGNSTDTVAVFAAAPFGTDIRGWWRQRDSGGSGKKCFFEIPVRSNIADRIRIDAGLTGADLNADVGVNNPNNDFVTPSVLIVADDNKSHVRIECRGCPAIGDRNFSSLSQVDDPQDVVPTLRQLHIVSARGDGNAWADRCLFDDSPEWHNGKIHFTGNIGIQLFVFHNVQAVTPLGMNTRNWTIAPCGQPEVFGQPLPGNADPIVPYNGSSLVQHGTLQIGSPWLGRQGSRLAFPFFISVHPSAIEGSTSARLVIQNGSQFTIVDNGGAYIESDVAAPAAIRLKDRSKMSAPFSAAGGRITIVDGAGAGNEIMVGRDIANVLTPAITKAALLAAPWNGIFQRALPDDDSLVINAAVEKTDADYSDGR